MGAKTSPDDILASFLYHILVDFRRMTPCIFTKDTCQLVKYRVSSGSKISKNSHDIKVNLHFYFLTWMSPLPFLLFDPVFDQSFFDRLIETGCDTVSVVGYDTSK